MCAAHHVSGASTKACTSLQFSAGWGKWKVNVGMKGYNRAEESIDGVAQS